MTNGFRETISNLAKVLTDEDMCSFICTIWSIWRMRNEIIHGGKKHSVEATKAFFKREAEACLIKRLMGSMIPSTLPNQNWEQPRDFQQDQQVYQYQCYVDGAWDSQGRAGIGVYVQQNGRVVAWKSKSIAAINPAQAEAKAVLEGYITLNQIAQGKGMVYSDSKDTVAALGSSVPLITDWRSYDELWMAWNLQGQLNGDLKTAYCSRLNPQLSKAHNLAKQARLYGWDNTGNIEPVFSLEEVM